MASRPVAELIDELLAARKTLSGIPDWRRPYNADEWRIRVPLRIAGTSTGTDLTVCTYPEASTPSWRMMINAPKCVWRVDHVDDDEQHVNSLERPKDLAEHSFRTPHFHAWEDNRHFCTHSSLPDRLLNARILPVNVHTFDNCLRWFLGQTNIDQPPDGLIVPPPRTRLLL